MFKTEWLNCGDPDPMLPYLEDRVRPGQLRLFACACCRRIDHRLALASQQTVTAIEQFEDGRIDWQQLRAALAAAEEAEAASSGPVRAAAMSRSVAEHASAAAAHATTDPRAEQIYPATVQGIKPLAAQSSAERKE
jgi:hypothetical protein